jgi:hypothetical protein
MEAEVRGTEGGKRHRVSSKISLRGGCGGGGRGSEKKKKNQSTLLSSR